MIQADVILDYDVVTLEQPQKLYLLLRIQAGPTPENTNRHPLNLSLIIDRSGSMAGEKIDYTLQAAQFLVQNLAVNDTLSIVLYNDKVETLLPPEHVQRKDIISQRLGEIEVSGTTNLSSGWLQGFKHVAETFHSESLNRVILMSDGLANRGITDPQKLIQMAQQKLSEGISTTTMGLGKDFNEDLLMALASAGGGAFYFIESPEVTPLIFKEELSGLLNVVAQNLTVQVHPGPDISKVTQLNAYPMHAEGVSQVYRLGDVFGDEIKALLLALSLPGIRQTGERQIAQLHITYDALTEDGTQHHTVDLPVMINVVPEGQQPQESNPEVQQSMLLLQAAQARKTAVAAADKGDFETAAQALRDVATAIEKARLDNLDLMEERSALIQQASELEAGAKYDHYSRKTMSTQAFYTMTSRHQDTMMLRIREQQRQPVTQPQLQRSAFSPSTAKKAGVTPTHVTWNNQTFPLDQDLIRIGRAPHNEITINAKGVSRFHCQITRNGEKLILQDLDSTNGTTREGIIITQPYTLSTGDVIYLCDEKLIFHDGSG